MSDIETLVDLATAAGIDRVFRVGEVPPEPRYPYAVLASSRLAPDTRRLDGGGDTPSRFTAQMFSQTADALEDMTKKMLAAFDAAFLPFPGEPQCRAEVTTPPYRDPDDHGVLNATHTYRY